MTRGTVDCLPLLHSVIYSDEEELAEPGYVRLEGIRSGYTTLIQHTHLVVHSTEVRGDHRHTMD